MSWHSPPQNAPALLPMNKETDRPINTMIDRELRDEKAVKVAIGRLYDGKYEIVYNGEEPNEEEISTPAAETENADE